MLTLRFLVLSVGLYRNISRLRLLKLVGMLHNFQSIILLSSVVSLRNFRQQGRKHRNLLSKNNYHSERFIVGVEVSGNQSQYLSILELSVFFLSLLFPFLYFFLSSRETLINSCIAFNGTPSSEVFVDRSISMEFQKVANLWRLDDNS